MTLATRVTQRSGCARVAVDRELELRTAGQLEVALGSAIDDPTRSIVLDLTAPRFGDSAGLAVGVRTHNQLSGHSRRLVRAGPNGPVLRELSGQNRVIAAATNPNDACVIAVSD
jgi:anti-anti-sigma factor